MEEMRKKWLESETKCKDLEEKLSIERSMFQRKINELKIDIETHHEKRLQAESKSEKLQIELEKLQKQFEAFKKILNDKNFDDERLNLITTYSQNWSTVHLAHNNHNYNEHNCSKRYNNRIVEDTGSIISDYTEDDLDIPNDEPNNLDICNINFNDGHCDAEMMSPRARQTPQHQHQHQHQQMNSMTNLNGGNQIKQTSGSALNQLVASSSNNNNNNNINNQQRRSTGRKRNQRQSTSLTRNGESRDKKRSRTRSTEMNRDAKQAAANTGKEITAITTLRLSQDGRPITVTSEIQHTNADGIKCQQTQMNQNSNKMELSFVPPRVKNRKKRPSREFLQRSADESESTEDSEVFWNGGEPLVAEIPINPLNPSNSNHQLNNVHIMTPIIEAPTPSSSRQMASNAYKLIQTPAATAASSKLGSQQKSISANSIPFSRKYKRSHSFKAQVILNGELCAHCDKRTKFGKQVQRCKHCDIIVHEQCKDLIQRPCYPINFPANGKISDYVLDEAPFIPPILQMILNEIEQRGLVSHEVGLYRVNGSDTQIKQLKERLIKRHQTPDLRKINDVHVLCSFVKEFLNNLNEHLITYDTWYRFAKACEIQNENERLTTLEQCVLDLPEANRDTLAFLILHLQRISETPECKMPIANLAKVFGQSIVGNSSPNPPAAEIINELKAQHQIVENLIRLPFSFYQSIIDGVEPGQQRLFKSTAKTPELMRKSKTAVVLSSILGPATNVPASYHQQQQQQQHHNQYQQHQQNQINSHLTTTNSRK